MKKRNLIIFLLALCLSLNYSITVLANESPQTGIEITFITPRYRYVQMASSTLVVSSSGAGYDMTISGSDAVNRITGTLTLYKDGSYVDSTTINEYSRYVSKNGTLKTNGSGNYKLTFNGTVYASNGSESISFEATDSY